MKIFRKTPLDLFLILYVVVAAVLPFAIAAFFNSALIWLVIAPLQATFLVIVMNTSMHHHMHTPIFNNKLLNRSYELFVSAVIGIPFQGWKTFHTIHHKYNNDSVINGKTYDPLSFYRYGKNGERENFWLYTVKGFWRDMTGITMLDKEDNCRTLIKINKQTEFRNEKIAFYIFLLLIATVNPIYAIFYIVCVYILSLILNNANSYGEHFGPVEQSNFRSNSVGNYNKIYNVLCFNSGLHQEHHVRPSVHWTELPKITKTLPEKRHTISTMYMFNAPLISDALELLKGKK
jgi:fatty acid desaturase